VALAVDLPDHRRNLHTETGRRSGTEPSSQRRARVADGQMAFPREASDAICREEKSA